MKNEIFGEMKDKMMPSEEAENRLMAKIGAEEKPKARISYLKLGVAAAGLCAAAVIAVAVIPALSGGGVPLTEQGSAPSTPENTLLPEVTKEATEDNPEYATEIGEEIAIDIAPILPWDSLSTPCKFGVLNIGGTEYYHWNGISDIGESIGRYTLTTEDYTGGTHSADAEAFKINGYSDKYAIALRFDGEQQAYAYINFDYHPATLGDMIETLNLKEALSFGTIYYDYENEAGNHVKVGYKPISGDKIWEMLLSDAAAVNEGDEHYALALIDISVSVEVLGISNVSLAVNADGYVQTNLAQTGSSFYIGIDKVNAFIEYVKANAEIEFSYEDAGLPISPDGADDDVDIQAAIAEDPDGFVVAVDE